MGMLMGMCSTFINHFSSEKCKTLEFFTFLRVEPPTSRFQGNRKLSPFFQVAPAIYSWCTILLHSSLLFFIFLSPFTDNPFQFLTLSSHSCLFSPLLLFEVNFAHYDCCCDVVSPHKVPYVVSISLDLLQNPILWFFFLVPLTVIRKSHISKASNCR